MKIEYWNFFIKFDEEINPSNCNKVLMSALETIVFEKHKNKVSSQIHSLHEYYNSMIKGQSKEIEFLKEEIKFLKNKYEKPKKRFFIF